LINSQPATAEMGRGAGGYTPRSGEVGATATIHVGGWNPVASGMPWTSAPLMIDQYSSRIGPSSQRTRDGKVRPDRVEKGLVNAPMGMNAKRGLKPHETKLKDGSPRNREPAIYEMGHGQDWRTATGDAYMPPAPHFLNQEPNRHAAANMRRISPGVYASVFDRGNKDSPRAMPQHAFAGMHGGATVPTAGDWMECPEAFMHPASARLNPPTQSPRLQAAENDFKMQLMELKLRSEARTRLATLALAADLQAQPLTDMSYTPRGVERHALSPRHVLSMRPIYGSTTPRPTTVA